MSSGAQDCLHQMTIVQLEALLYWDSGQLLLFNPGDILRCSGCYQRPKRWGTYFLTISKIDMSFKMLDRQQNLTPLRNWVETELPSLSCLNNLQRQTFVNMSSHIRSTPSSKVEICYYCLNILTCSLFRSNNPKNE